MEVAEGAGDDFVSGFGEIVRFEDVALAGEFV
jgi:hypothetical protein